MAASEAWILDPGPGSRSGADPWRRPRCSRPRGRSRAALTAALAAVLACAATSCAQAPAPSGSTDAAVEIQVTAAESVWGAVAEALGGDEVHVTSIMTGSTFNTAAFKPTAAQLRAFSGAQLVILTGAGYDPWADQAVSAQHGVQRLEVNVGDQVGVLPGGDPYLWNDPQFVEQAAQQITADFIQLRPADTSYFQQQAANFKNGAVAAFSAQLGSIKDKYAGVKVGASDPVAERLASAMSLDLVTPSAYLNAGGASQAPAATQQRVMAQITGRQIEAFIYDVQDHSAAASAELKAATAAQIPVAAISEEAEPNGVSFQQWQTTQLDSIQQALAAATGGASG